MPSPVYFEISNASNMLGPLASKAVPLVVPYLNLAYLNSRNNTQEIHVPSCFQINEKVSSRKRSERAVV
jgi:hypothetical protein